MDLFSSYKSSTSSEKSNNADESKSIESNMSDMQRASLSKVMFEEAKNNYH